MYILCLFPTLLVDIFNLDSFYFATQYVLKFLEIASKVMMFVCEFGVYFCCLFLLEVRSNIYMTRKHSGWKTQPPNLHFYVRLKKILFGFQLTNASSVLVNTKR